jgi:hypothetical protein
MNIRKYSYPVNRVFSTSRPIFADIGRVNYLRGIKTKDLPPFTGRLWQRNYYEHVIRDEPSLDRIRQYVLENPGGGRRIRRTREGKDKGLRKKHDEHCLTLPCSAH